MNLRITTSRRHGLEVLGGTTILSLILGLLLVLGYYELLSLPSDIYWGLLSVGMVGGAAVNGYRSGHIFVSWLSTGIGVFPMAFAFAPSGPPELSPTLGEILLTAGGITLVIGLVVGSVSYVFGRVVRSIL